MNQPVETQREHELEYDGQAFRELVDEVTQRLCEHLDSLETQPLKNNQAGYEVARKMNRDLPEQATELKQLLDDLFNDFVPHTFNTASPGYLAYVPGGGLPDSAIADLISALTNRYITVFTASPALATIEQLVIVWIAQLLGMPEQTSGFLTTGGSLANWSAIVTARVKHLEHDFRKATLYTSTQVHHCVDKSVFMAGIPIANMRRIAVDDQFRIQVSELRKTIEQDLENGMQPFMLIANGGSTNTGAVDDLTAMAELAQEFNLWMHVDAAYGGFFAMTERGRKILAGLDQADSVTLDPHKGLFLPYGTGCLLVKNKADLLAAHSFTSDYMPEMSSDPWQVDMCEISPELSRGFRGLRVWLPMKLHGVDAFRKQLDEKLDLSEWSCDQIEAISQLSETRFNIAPPIQIVARPQLSILAFRLKVDGLSQEAENDLNERWLSRINAANRVMLTHTLINQQFVIRICVLSFRTHLDRMQEAMEILESTAVEVLEEMEIGEASTSG